jgi:hypothetical protein
MQKLLKSLDTDVIEEYYKAFKPLLRTKAHNREGVEILQKEYLKRHIKSKREFISEEDISL